jgi:DeoR/GlpR family transcriptional regulator of sugar metabolism
VLTQQRKRLLLDVLRRDRRIVAKDAARDLDVSEDTIRRDLRELARDGLLLRVHGGALPASQAVQDLGARQAISVPEKAAIGRAAAAMVRPGQVVFIDGGTTAVQLARSLGPELRATVVTHSPTIAVELAGHAVDVQMIGGRLFRHSMVAVGAAALDAIRRVRADAYFMGVTGIHLEIGLTTGDAEEAAIKRALMEASAEVVVLGSPEKLGAASPFVIAPADAMTTLIVPATVPPAELAPYEALGVGIVRAAMGGSGQP